MMPSNGPPTPKGVGGPTPPLVSRGSGEEGGTKIPTGGPPFLEGRGGPTSSPLGRGEASAATRGRVGPIRTRTKDEDPPPTQRGGGDHSLTQEGAHEPPPTWEGIGKKEERETGSQQNRPDTSTRRNHTSQELRMLDHSEEPLPKRVRWPTKGMATDNSCEVMRESNMICPITCGCHNSLLDIKEKTRVVSHILRSTRKIWKNELIAIFGLTAAITNKNVILELRKAQEERNSDLYRTSIQYTVLGNIHGKEVYLVPPQDEALLLEERISPTLRKQLKRHNAIEGVG